MRKIVGLAIVASPFVVITGLSLNENGIIDTFFAWCGAIAIACIVHIGLRLIKK